MAEPFVIVNRRCLPSPALPFSFLPPWLFYLLRKQKRSRVSAQGRKCTRRLGSARSRLCHPPTAAGAPRCHRHPGDSRAPSEGCSGMEILPLLRTAVGHPAPKHRDSRLQKFPHLAPSWFGWGFCSVNFCSCCLGSQARSFCPSSTNNSQMNLSFCLFRTFSLPRFATF